MKQNAVNHGLVFEKQALDTLKIADIKNKYKLNDKVLRSMTLISERPEGLPVLAALNLE